LASFASGEGKLSASNMSIPLLPFIQDVVARYLSHPSNEVRRAAALTCCLLLVPASPSVKVTRINSYSGLIVEDVLRRLLQSAVSDPAPDVRLCIVQALDSRYDEFLIQSHHLRELFLLLQDETLATRSAGLRLLGRIASINPAPILPVLRRLLNDIIVELRKWTVLCVGHGVPVFSCSTLLSILMLPSLWY
jgi:serine/threonine-protein kinase mTOR